MRERSNSEIPKGLGMKAGGEYSPLRLPPDFPVSRPHHVRRSEANAIRPHVHECLELGFCREGNGIFLIGEKMLHCGPGDAVAIRQGEMHLLVSPRGESTSWTFVNLDPVGLLAGSLRELGELDCAPLASKSFMNLVPCSKHPDICSLVKDLTEELDGGRPGYRQAVRAIAWALMAKLRRLAEGGAKEESPDPRGFDELDRLRPALKALAEGFAKELSMTALAKLCRMSQANFRRVFQRRLGVAPRDYLLRLRLEVAKSLLKNSSWPVLDISLKAGFPTLSNFNRQFKRAVGRSPREFRRGEPDFERGAP